MHKIRVLLLTDSLGCPRKEINVCQTWTDKLMSCYSAGDVIFYTNCVHGLFSKSFSFQYINEIEPDVIICQYGVVDAARRALSKRAEAYINKIPIVRRIVRKICSKYHYFLTRIYNIHYGSEQDFASSLNRLLDVPSAAKIFFIDIASPGKYLRENTYHIKEDITAYNKILAVHVNSRFEVIFPYGDREIDSILLNDGHHLTVEGNNIVFNCVREKLNDFIKTFDGNTQRSLTKNNMSCIISHHITSHHITSPLLLSNSRNIVIIGLGGIGYRHLQSIYELRDSANIFAVEIDSHRCEVLREEFPSVYFAQTVSDLPDNIDAAIIATTSNVRRRVFDELVEHCKVKFILFEKVLFQRHGDYYHVQEVLRSKNISAWVNCARREIKSWQELKEFIDELDDGNLHFTFSCSGGKWGLGCNTVHMLDLIQFLSGSDDLIVNADLLPYIVDSKRPGFREFFGSINGSCGKCIKYNILCFDNSSLPCEIYIDSEKFRAHIFEGEGCIMLASESNNWQWERKDFTLEYVSKTTAKIINSMLQCGSCNLSSYDEAMKIHLKFIDSLRPFLINMRMEEDLCPVT